MKPAALVVLLLAGCSGQSLPPPTPSPADVQIATATVNAINVPSADYLIYGTTLAAMNCIGWFGSQIAAQTQNSALSGELGLLGTAAGVAGGPAGAAAAAAMGFGVSSLANAQHNAAAGIDPVATYSLVRKVQQAWLATAPAPRTLAEAYMLVEDFAEKCQLPEIRGAIVAAVSTAPVRAVPMSGAAAFGLVPEAPRRVMPPTIVIGEQPTESQQGFREAPGRSSRSLGRRDSHGAAAGEPGNMGAIPIRQRPRQTAHVGSAAWFRQTSTYIPALDGPR